jgi:hypothetical protein
MNYSFDAVSDIVVIGTDAEAADYDNPRGELYGIASYVRAIDEQGNTKILYVATGQESDVVAKAQTLADRLNARLANFGKLPIGFDKWEDGRPVYGSDAYDSDEEIAWERRAEEDSLLF